MRTVIITGAGRGIGREIARLLARDGYFPVVTDIDLEMAQRTDALISGEGYQCAHYQMDVSDPQEIANTIEVIARDLGNLYGLVNNAGISANTDPEQLSIADWDRILNINLRGAFLCSREAAKFIITGGSIVNISSTRAMMSEAHTEAYSASKAGLIGLTHAMAVSLSAKSIRVNCISPGWIHTGNHEGLRSIDHQQHPANRVGEPGDIARLASFLLNPENDFITGANFTADGGMTRKMIYEH